MTDLASIAISAAMAEEISDLRDALDKLSKPETIRYDTIADFVMTRLGPRLTLLEERSARIAVDVTMLKTRVRRRG